MRKQGLLLVNLGTPDEPSTRAVRRYLREFLSDPRVLDVPPFLRAFLLYAIILPRRPSQSAEAYRKIWTERGSPLLLHGKDLVAKVQERIGADVVVKLAMRYQSPSIGGALEEFRVGGVDEVIVFPLFPQYSSSTWGSAVEKVCAEASSRWNVPVLHFVRPFFDHPAFLDAFAAVARPALDAARPDHVVMSFHGLPVRQISKGDESGGTHCLRSASCCEAMGAHNRNCYRAQCVATARGLEERLGLAEEDLSITFQSRLGREEWIRPYTDETIVRLARMGIRRLAVLSPAFVADCLETLEELGIRARESFLSQGGEDLQLIPSLNADDRWADAVVQIARDRSVLRANA